MKKKVIYGLLIAFFIICSFKLVSILKNKEYYTKLLDEKTNIYVYGISAPRGRILDCNGKVLVDNIGIKTIYYNKIKGIIKSKELEIAGLLANILSVDEATIDELKEYYLINNNDGKYLITDEEYKLFEERKKYYYINSIGSDEVGTGDFFGPVVVTASYVSKDNIPFLEELGVRDSKKLTDQKILEIVPKIIKFFA